MLLVLKKSGGSGEEELAPIIYLKSLVNKTLSSIFLTSSHISYFLHVKDTKLLEKIF
jgi:hypothetical protein